METYPVINEIPQTLIWAVALVLALTQILKNLPLERLPFFRQRPPAEHIANVLWVIIYAAIVGARLLGADEAAIQNAGESLTTILNGLWLLFGGSVVTQLVYTGLKKLDAPIVTGQARHVSSTPVGAVEDTWQPLGKAPGRTGTHGAAALEHVPENIQG